jgi:cold shock CspA family protein
MVGTVHIYYESRGYGFISVSFKERRFFHIDNYKGEVVPVPGWPVELDLAPSKTPGKPDQAIHVRPVETEVGGAQ